MSSLKFGILFILCGSFAAQAENIKPIIFWHSQTGMQARFVEKLVDEFNSQYGASIRAETGLELESSLIAELDNEHSPQAILLPADFLGMHDAIGLSEVPSSWLREPLDPAAHQAITLGDTTRANYGVPILSGNHLMLFYNRQHVKEPPKTWTELEAISVALEHQQQAAIGWPYSEPYYLLPFLGAFDGSLVSNGKLALNSPAMRRALTFYRDLAIRQPRLPACDFDCGGVRFIKGEFAMTLGGDWSLAEAESKLRHDLGVAPLPRIGEKPLISGAAYQLLVFPHHSLTGPNRSILEKLAAFLQSEPIQKRWWTEAKRLPASPETLSVLSRGCTDPLLTDDLAAFKASRQLPAHPELFFAWPAIRKGIRSLDPKLSDNGLRPLKDVSEISLGMQIQAQQLQALGFRKTATIQAPPPLAAPVNKGTTRSP